jgi:queuine tRNA-ribosyltransferase
MILANTYHLMLRPGAATVNRLGGLHKLMAWGGPILTDSGGFQVFSLADMRKIDDGGVVFKSHINGDVIGLSPRGAMEIQHLLGADVIMQLDECPPADAPKDQVASAVRRSSDWARLCKQTWQYLSGSPAGNWLSPETVIKDDADGIAGAGQLPALAHPGHVQSLFGIQQGGVFADLRRQSAEALVDLDLPGYAIGGLSVGEGHAAMVDVLGAIGEQFPVDKPRYLMGVGEPRDILAGVASGIDMFDCVLPTRNGRNSMAYTWSGPIRLRNARWSQDRRPLDENCTCYTCRNYSRGTLRHLFLAREMLGPTLASIHNLHFFADFMSAIRQAISEGDLQARSRQWMDELYPTGGNENQAGK